MPQIDVKKSLILAFLILKFLRPDLRYLMFENVKLNLKYRIADLKIGQEPNFRQLH